jgi:pyruvate kinase
MTVARLNFSHGTFEQYEQDIALIRNVNKKYKRNIKDTWRFGRTQNQNRQVKRRKAYRIKKGPKLVLTNKKI